MEVFISYADEDRAVSIQLESKLLQSGIIVHRDKSDLRFGDDWKDKLFPIIRRSDKFILLWSVFSAESVSVMEEIIEAKSTERKIINCLLDETPISPLLRQIHYIDFKNNNLDINVLVSDLVSEYELNYEDEAIDLNHAVHAYKQLVIGKFSSLQVLFSGSERPINDNYIELTLKNGLGNETTNDTISANSLLERVQNSNENIIIAGHPGTGKSSTLHYLLYKWANSRSNHILIYSRLKDFEPSLHDSLEELVNEDFLKVLDERKRVIDIFYEANYLEKLKITILFDGLDELKAGYYDTFVKQLRAFFKEYRNCSLIITSRIDGFRNNREVDFIGWQKYSILKLDDKKIQLFIEKWFCDKDKQNRLLSRLINPRIKALSRRTFLLAMICLVFEDDEDKLGNNRSELYFQATSYLERDRLNQYTNRIIQFRREVLGEIGFRFLQLNNQELPENFLLAFIDKIKPADLKFDSFEFLESIVKDTGIIQNCGRNYVFTHKSFQEYYAAIALDKTPFGEGVLLDYCQIQHWEEVIRLYVGAIKSRAFQEKFILNLWNVNPALALRTITECTNIEQSFLQKLISNSNSENRVRMVREINESLRKMDLYDARRLAIETFRPLFKMEFNSEVLYHCIQILEEFDPEDEGEILFETFFRDQNSIVKILESEEKYKFKFVKIESGSFFMGDDHSGEKHESPSHEVSISAFEICKFQLTNLAYELIMGKETSKREENISELDDTPVVNLSWYDAYICAYKIGYRLPSEAEWEYMARAESKSNWFFGDDLSGMKSYMNCFENGSGFSKTWRVGSGLPNNWGIYDVHGNVWEWCEDWFADYSKLKKKNPRGPKNGDTKVRRGGGFAYHSSGCRSAFRWGNDPNYKFKDIGVRLVRDIIDSRF